MRPATEPSPGQACAAYLRLLLLLLASAAFFDGYDNEASSLLLTNVQHSFGASVTTLGLIRIPIAAGQFVAFFAAFASDRAGRRPLLIWSILGYTTFTVATAFSPDIWAFAGFQLGAQTFTAAEFAVAVALVVEEFPTQRRGRALGTLLAMGPLGTIVVGLLSAAGLQRIGFSWRPFYVVGVIPLLAVAVARRRLRESWRFSAALELRLPGPAGAPGGALGEPSRAPTQEPAAGTPGSALLHPSDGRTRLSDLLAAWRPGTRRLLVAVGVLSLCQAVPVAAGTYWWPFYAERDQHFSVTLVSLFFIAAAAVGVGGYYSCGRLMERFGRRPTAALYISATVVFGAALFQVRGEALSFVALVGAVFFGLGIGPVISAFATECFPTQIRAQAGSWARNVFASAGMILGPALVGVLGARGGPVGSIGDTATILVAVALPSLFIIWRALPETRGRDLSELAADWAGPSPA
ncbi:MAG: MFS transporter [Acidimicrobiales bacterium]